jgi:hypothetical protein
MDDRKYVFLYSLDDINRAVLTISRRGGAGVVMWVEWSADVNVVVGNKRS